MLKALAKSLILIYKRTFSHVVGQGCIYTPTCSMYAYDAVDKYGVLVGSAMSFARILRCNPFAKGGFDPVKENLRGQAKWLL
ncbi:MAG: membrane protein insertion efficiency factor YidD [Christensenellaceae bacterium]|jgi:putative membrane protein insertion efficiency factor|nr:membrane protein insertion efficiency factor YidD [Christensenellaceae bacterium]